MQTRWYVDFFNRKEEVERQGKWAVVTDSEVSAIAKILGISPGMKLLDLACGSGRYSIAFAAKGYNVTGVDISEPCIEEAAKKAGALNINARFKALDMLSMDYDSEFDAVICINSSFGMHDSDEEHQKILDNIGRSLKTNGKLLLGLIAHDPILADFEKDKDLKKWAGKDFSFDYETKQLISSQNLHGTDSSMSVTLRLFPLPELENMLKKAGMKITGVFSGHNGEPFTKSSKNMIAIAEKA